MGFRSAVILGSLIGFAGLGQAQPGGSNTPLPPDKAALDRLNLRTEWAINVPMEGRRDFVTLVQSFDDQLFVQTRAGRLFAVDAANGRVQWGVTLGNGEFTTTYAVAVNSRFVFVMNVTTLIAFYRYTGLVEFTTDLGTLPTAGLTADDYTIYAVLAIRPGYAGQSRIEAFQLPRPIGLPSGEGQVKGGDLAAVIARGTPQPNPVDTLLERYPKAGVRLENMPDAEIGAQAPSLRTVPTGGYSGSKTPSLAATTSVYPPYISENRIDRTPSLIMVPSLRQPYRSLSASRTTQYTPSLSAIPPSIAASLALSDLRPKGIRPSRVLEVGLTQRLLYPLLLAPYRVWGATDSDQLVAVSTISRAREVVARLSDRVAATPAQAGELGYFPLADGNLLAIDLTGGNLVGGANVVWRATVGGLVNHAPLVNRDFVYASGDDSGVTSIDRATGYVRWKSEPMADRVLAANDEFAYLRDRQGRLLIYDARASVDSSVRTARPLTAIDISAFNVPFTNTVSDRLYLTAENGLIVCLRDASAKYARPVRMTPELRTAVKKEPKKEGDMPPTTTGDTPPKAP